MISDIGNIPACSNFYRPLASVRCTQPLSISSRFWEAPLIRTSRWLMLALLATVPGRGLAQTDRPASFLYVWAGDADTLDSDFLAVIDVRPGSQTYARILSTVPVGARATTPHHTEHQLERDGVLFANGFGAGRTFRFDLARPNRPRLLGSRAVAARSQRRSRTARLRLLSAVRGKGPRRAAVARSEQEW